MPDFNRSLTAPLPFSPWRYTTQPTYNPDGSIATPGVKETLDGCFVLISDAIVTELEAGLTTAQKAELAGWITRFTAETPPPAGFLNAAEWNVPLWSGQSTAVYVHIPPGTMPNPNSPVPAKVDLYFGQYYQ